MVVRIVEFMEVKLNLTSGLTNFKLVNMKKYIKLTLLILLVSCIDKVDLISSTNNRTLIIDAVITTEIKKHQITLSYSYDFDADEPTYAKNASVGLTDENGNSFSFQQINEKGVYEATIPFKAEENIAYTLVVNTEEGKTYTSKPEKTSGASTIDKISVRTGTDNLNNDGVYFTVETQDSDDAKYFKYDYVETFRIVAPYWTNERLVVESIQPFEYRKELGTDAAKICYVSNSSKDIIIHDIVSSNSTKVNFDFLFYKKNNYKINERHSILLKQRVQSFDAYNYYKALKKISSSDDIFSGVQPGNISNNIIPSDTNDNVIGYFEVSHVSTKRFFFNYTDLYDDMEVNYIEDCQLLNPPLSGELLAPSPLLLSLQAGNLYYADGANAAVPFTLVTEGCGDCRKYGNTEKPNFWID